MANPHTFVQTFGSTVVVIRLSALAIVALALRAAQLSAIKALALELPIEALPGEENLLAEFTREQADKIPDVVWRCWADRAPAPGDADDLKAASLVLRLCADGSIQVDTSVGRQTLIDAGQLAAMSGVEHAAGRRFAEVTDPVPVLSTAHLTCEQREDLSEGRSLPGILTLYNDDCGWLLYRQPDVDGEHDAVPENLGEAFAWAHALGTPYLRFDADGGEIPGFLRFFDDPREDPS